MTDHVAVLRDLRDREQFKLDSRLHRPDWEKQRARVNAINNAIAAIEERDALGNLLAVIHRDGGHYTAQHGIIKSVQDAETSVFALLSASEERDKLVARLGELERVWRLDASSSFPDEDNRENVEAMDRQLLNCADDLARVVEDFSSMKEKPA